MTIKIAASKCSLFFCALFIPLTAITSVRGADGSVDPPQRITIELWLAEISVDKVRKADFAWESVGAGEKVRTELVDIFTSPEQAQRSAGYLQGRSLTDLLTFLESYKLAHIIAQPTLSTQRGQQASFEAGPTKLEATPTIKEDGRIRLGYNFQFRQPKPSTDRKAPASWNTFGSSCTVDLNPGQATLVIPAKFDTVTSNTPLALFIRASIGKPPNDAAGTVSRKGTFLEVVPSKTR